MLKRKNLLKGQSIIEYVLLVAAVIAILIFFLRPGGMFDKSVTSTLEMSTNGMTQMGNRLLGSRP